jgi:hypothetical protein
LLLLGVVSAGLLLSLMKKNSRVTGFVQIANRVFTMFNKFSKNL